LHSQSSALLFSALPEANTSQVHPPYRIASSSALYG
jgi:hypothetical protein